jgi:hypothetical protein
VFGGFFGGVEVGGVEGESNVVNPYLCQWPIRLEIQPRRCVKRSVSKLLLLQMFWEVP